MTTEIEAAWRRLKPLAWEDYADTKWPGSCADSPWGTYEVCSHLRGKIHWRFMRDGFTKLVECTSIDHGKEFRSADYRDRVAGLFEE